MNFENEIIKFGRVVGIGADDGEGHPVWPTLELLTGGYYFTWRHDDGRFMGKIAEFILEDFIAWMKSQDLKDELLYFMEDTIDLKMEYASEMMNLLNHGSEEANYSFDELIHGFYEAITK